ncbi:hypothetical protein Droror1_Dr00027202, partial [Drosera rotundifolia]
MTNLLLKCIFNKRRPALDNQFSATVQYTHKQKTSSNNVFHGRNNRSSNYAPLTNQQFQKSHEQIDCGPISNPPVCQFCDKPGHTAKTCCSIHGRPKAEPVVNHTSSVTDSSNRRNIASPWLLDSRASHH